MGIWFWLLLAHFGGLWIFAVHWIYSRETADCISYSHVTGKERVILGVLIAIILLFWEILVLITILMVIMEKFLRYVARKKYESVGPRYVKCGGILERMDDWQDPKSEKFRRDFKCQSCGKTYSFYEDKKIDQICTYGVLSPAMKKFEQSFWRHFL